MTRLKPIKFLTALPLLLLFSPSAVAQGEIRILRPDEPPGAAFPAAVAELHLEQSRRLELQHAITARNYKRAETILVEEAEREPKSPLAAKALVLAGGIFFLDAQYLNSVIAWKKAEAIAPLDERSRFTLAMAFIKLNHREWARPELEKLANDQPQNPLYPYWLARLDYDARNYTSAIDRLHSVLALDPKMMRAYDTLGLCYDYLGQFDEAIRNYQQAVALNRLQPKPSPWPHVDLAVSLISANRLADAETSLREALGYDSHFPQAHYQLGRVLEMRGELQPASAELERAAALDPAYAEPHFLLGRIYHRLRQPEKARAEIARYQQLKPATDQKSAALP
jgi:tetratricopeptide (TPR) repeat protein